MIMYLYLVAALLYFQSLAYTYICCLDLSWPLRQCSKKITVSIITKPTTKTIMYRSQNSGIHSEAVVADYSTRSLKDVKVLAVHTGRCHNALSDLLERFYIRIWREVIGSSRKFPW